MGSHSSKSHQRLGAFCRLVLDIVALVKHKHVKSAQLSAMGQDRKIPRNCDPALSSSLSNVQIRVPEGTFPNPVFTKVAGADN